MSSVLALIYSIGHEIVDSRRFSQQLRTDLPLNLVRTTSLTRDIAVRSSRTVTRLHDLLNDDFLPNEERCA